MLPVYPGGMTQEGMKDVALMVVNPTRAAEDIKILWAAHEKGTS